MATNNMNKFKAITGIILQKDHTDIILIIMAITNMIIIAIWCTLKKNITIMSTIIHYRIFIVNICNMSQLYDIDDIIIVNLTIMERSCVYSAQKQNYCDYSYTL